MTNKSSVTEFRIGFKEIIPAQVFWASLEDPRQYHIAAVIDQHSNEILCYLVEDNGS